MGPLPLRLYISKEKLTKENLLWNGYPSMYFELPMILAQTYSDMVVDLGAFKILPNGHMLLL